MSFAIVSSILLGTLATLIGVFVMRLTKKKTELPLPPGPSGIPILGNLHQIDPESPHKSFSKMADKYATNGLFGIQLGAVYTVVLTDYTVVKEALSKEAFMGRPPLYLTHGIMEGYGLIASDGDLWKDQRKLLSSWMRILGAARGALSRPHLYDRLSLSVDAIEKKISSSLYNKGGVDIRHLLTNTIGDTINVMSFGVSFQDDDPVWKWLLFIQEEGVKAMGVAGILNFLPYLRYFSASLAGTLNAIVKGQNQTHKFVHCYKNIRKNYMNQKKGTSYEVDEKALNGEMDCTYYAVDSKTIPITYSFKPSSLFVHDGECIMDYFLEERERRKQAGDLDGLNRLSDKQLAVFMCDIFGAGLDTSNNTLGWFFFMMALYPKEQELIRKELHTVCDKSKPNCDHMANLVYTRAAICETQRIRPVVPLGFPHGTVHDAMLAGYHIPKGSMLMPFQWYIHHDPRIWESPEDFRPSRFIASDGTLLQPPSFIPFQSGKRMCPGDEFARMITFVFGARILSRFEIEFAEPPKNTEGIFGLTLCPPNYKLKMKPLFEWSDI